MKKNKSKQFNYNRSIKQRKKKTYYQEKKNVPKEQSNKIGTLLWIVIVLFFILWLIDLFKGGTYGYDYYPFRNLYNR